MMKQNYVNWNKNRGRSLAAGRAWYHLIPQLTLARFDIERSDTRPVGEICCGLAAETLVPGEALQRLAQCPLSVGEGMLAEEARDFATVGVGEERGCCIDQTAGE